MFSLSRKKKRHLESLDEFKFHWWPYQLRKLTPAWKLLKKKKKKDTFSNSRFIVNYDKLWLGVEDGGYIPSLSQMWTYNISMTRDMVLMVFSQQHSG